MSSRHLVDPQLLPMLDSLPQLVLSEAALPALRGRVGMSPLPPVVQNAVLRRDVRVPGPAGAPEVLLVTYTPPGPGPFPCIYHMHGGGMVSGSALLLEFTHRPLAEDLGCVIVSVEYRLAPETRFPGGIEDCYAGLVWTVANAATLNIDASRVGLMGESAGGGLAGALALLARDRGTPGIAFQVLTSPMLDDRTGTVDRQPHVGEFLWTPHNNRFGWRALLGEEPGGPDTSPYAAPARAASLRCLPPTFIMTGALDLFVHENIKFAGRLVSAGVPTELHIYAGAFHAFDACLNAEVAERARRDRLAALRRYTLARISGIAPSRDVA